MWQEQFSARTLRQDFPVGKCEFLLWQEKVKGQDSEEVGSKSHPERRN